MNKLDNREDLLHTVRGFREELNSVIAEAGQARMEQPGSFGGWTFKDVIAHLTSWRLATAARLEAGLRDAEPVFPWPSDLDEANDVDAINHWFYRANRDKPLDQVLSESDATFERVERAITELSEDALLKPGQFAWLHWTDEALGPAVVRGTLNHYRKEHEPDIRAWLEHERPE